MEGKMSITLRRDPRAILPDFIDWFEEPIVSLRPYLSQPMRIEEYQQDGRYVVRAEIAGIDPEKDLEVMAGDGYLVITAERTSTVEDKHRSEFRYGSFSRTIALPPTADSDNVTADYDHGILTVKVALKDEEKQAAKKIQVTAKK